MDKTKHSHKIRQKAIELGFDFCGFAQAAFLEEEAPRLDAWLNQGMHGKMSYMENWHDKRLDPRLLVEGAKTVVSLMANYYPEKDLAENGGYKIAKYAYGEDYHNVLKEKTKLLMAFIHAEIGEVSGRAFTDSAPVMERAWAQKAGLGWIGKNSLLLHKQAGSFFFLAELIIDLETEYDGPVKDYCGNCTRCMDACPTEAIPVPFIVDGSKCISYLTIELKEAIPQNFEGKMENWVFGCDICQDVCPWNRFAKAHKEPAFSPALGLQNMTRKGWEEITQEVFGEMFRKSAIKRAKWEGLAKNVAFVKGGE